MDFSLLLNFGVLQDGDKRSVYAWYGLIDFTRNYDSRFRFKTVGKAQAFFNENKHRALFSNRFYHIPIPDMIRPKPYCDRFIFGAKDILGANDDPDEVVVQELPGDTSRNSGK